VLQRRADWEVEKLTFTIVADAGFSAGEAAAVDVRPATGSVASFPAGTSRIGWWARLGERFVPYSDRMRVRWLAPDGRIAQDEKAQRPRKPYITSSLDLATRKDWPAGTWTVEAHIDDDVIDHRTFRLEAR
jgi:hypothetical protein